MFLKIDLEVSATSVTGIGWLSLGSRIIDDFLSFYFLVISIFLWKMYMELQSADTVSNSVLDNYPFSINPSF